MRVVVLDTNALMMPYEFGINFEKELNRLLGVCRIIVPSAVIKEMEILAEKEGSRGRAAQLGLNIVKKRGFRLMETDKDGDDGVMDVAIKMDGAILTNDKELKKKARNQGLAVIYLRGANKLEIEENL